MIVHANVYDPSRPSLFRASKNEKAECQTIECSDPERCDLHKNGMCACRSSVSYYCPYGLWHVETGYTRRANRFREWVRARMQKYDGVAFLDIPSVKLAVVGDFIYLPYPHMNNMKELFEKGCFVPKEKFTVDKVLELCRLRPQAMFGGEIKSYQKDVVPSFVVHLREKMHGFYEELCKRDSSIAERLKSYSNVGREALLSTVKPNVGVLTGIHGDEWAWDGEYLTMTGKQAGFALVKHSEVRIRPVDGAVVKVCSEDQTDDKTVFID